jgi:UDP-glucuronate 4-epimerase
MKILVTGAAGFIGRNLIDHLSLQEVSIIAVDNLNSLLYSKSFKKLNFKHISKHKNVTCFEYNVLSLPYTKTFTNFDCIINLAALPGQQLSWEHTENYTESNFLAVNSLLKRFCVGQSTHFIQASTSSIYGTHAVTKRNSIPNPNNPYGITKLAAENLIKAYSDNFQVNYSILRLFSVYGPYQRPDMGVYKFLEGIKAGKLINIYGNGSQSRSLTYVEDVVKVLNLILINRPQNIISDVSGKFVYSVNEIVSACEFIVGKKAKINYVNTPPGDQLYTKGNSTLLANLYGIKLETDIYFGLEQQFSQMTSS